MKRNIFQKIEWYISWYFVRMTKIFSEKLYKKLYKKLLKSVGMDIVQDEYYIDPTAIFDNYDYSLIHIGKNVTISRDVLFLTHDYSLYVGIRMVDDNLTSGLFLKDIRVEDNCFIGARVTLLPGTHIGKNSIIGAGAVVKGIIPENSIVIGNPGKVVCRTNEWAKRHIEKSDFIYLDS